MADSKWNRTLEALKQTQAGSQVNEPQRVHSGADKNTATQQAQRSSMEAIYTDAEIGNPQRGWHSSQAYGHRPRPFRPCARTL